MENLVKELKLIVISEDNESECYGAKYDIPTDLQVALDDLNKTLEEHFIIKE